MADEYILTHKRTFGEGIVNGQQSSCSGRTGKPTVSYGECGSFRTERSTWKKDDSRICNYCQRKGHWKNECPVLNSKAKLSNIAQVKPAALAASVGAAVPLEPQKECDFDVLCPSVCESVTDDDYAAFISNGYISLPGKTEVAVKILRDTGAVFLYHCLQQQR